MRRGKPGKRKPDFGAMYSLCMNYMMSCFLKVRMIISCPLGLLLPQQKEMRFKQFYWL